MKSNGNIALNFKTTGFKDYKASRFLLMNDFFIQGITLASSSVEKYLKSILISNGVKKPVHLDKLKDLKKEFKKINNNILNSLDATFLEILGQAYKLRYYDNFKEKISFGFLVHQIITELDFTIKLLDSNVIITNDKTGEIIKSDYQKAISSSDKKICDANYIVLGQSKKAAMECTGKGYFLMVDEIGQEFEMQGGGFSVPEYKGEVVKVKELSLK
ncbi:HEPN domain-containing protein [Carboxylicivirga sediminis]|uniref:HEPN domain-containing protein n=1 Tax=Carboxylicivirga sediminis TaxID=2006564 RepID=A0A941F8K9_9BACT|nr:HEPN domain-containing protein [Carboxylicivirga sediminis]MBR8538374.1 HEPN domain-containing protein [Carboxylicivirga sediminis]